MSLYYQAPIKTSKKYKTEWSFNKQGRDSNDSLLAKILLGGLLMRIKNLKLILLTSTIIAGSLLTSGLHATATPDKGKGSQRMELVQEIEALETRLDALEEEGNPANDAEVAELTSQLEIRNGNLNALMQRTRAPAGTGKAEKAAAEKAATARAAQTVDDEEMARRLQAEFDQEMQGAQPDLPPSYEMATRPHMAPPPGASAYAPPPGASASPTQLGSLAGTARRHVEQMNREGNIDPNLADKWGRKLQKFENRSPEEQEASLRRAFGVAAGSGAGRAGPAPAAVPAAPVAAPAAPVASGAIGIGTIRSVGASTRVFADEYGHGECKETIGHNRVKKRTCSFNYDIVQPQEILTANGWMAHAPLKTRRGGIHTKYLGGGFADKWQLTQENNLTIEGELR